MEGVVVALDRLSLSHWLAHRHLLLVLLHHHGLTKGLLLLLRHSVVLSRHHLRHLLHHLFRLPEGHSLLDNHF